MMRVSSESAWFTRAATASPTVSLIREPHVDDFLQSNIWHVRGAARDLVVDSGLGVVSLRQTLPELFLNDPVLVVTHAHLDHVGGASEFADVRVHPAERFAGPFVGSLRGPELASLLGFDPSAVPPVLLSALPHAGYDLDAYAVPQLETDSIAEGDEIDLGDRRLSALHLPGHSPGSVALWDAAQHELFTGDVLYDGELLDELVGSDRQAYRRSLLRLRALPVQTVFPGHGGPFDRTRMKTLIDAYLARSAS